MVHNSLMTSLAFRWPFNVFQLSC